MVTFNLVIWGLLVLQVLVNGRVLKVVEVPGDGTPVQFELPFEEFKNAGVAQFGSGWVWLVRNGDKLEVTKTANADNPLAHGQKALLTIDVWEHAYYLDYQNRRPDYISDLMEKLIDWDFVAANLAEPV